MPDYNEYYVFTEDRVENIMSAKVASACVGIDMEILSVEKGVITVLNKASSEMGIRVQEVSRDTMVVVQGGVSSVTGSDPKGIQRFLVRSEAEPQEALGCEKIKRM